MYKTNCLCSILFWDKFLDLYTEIYGRYDHASDVHKTKLSPAILTYYKKSVMIHQGHMLWLFELSRCQNVCRDVNNMS